MSKAPVASTAHPRPFKRLRSETLVLSAEKAKQAAETHQGFPRSPTERERDPRRVKELLDRIKAGVFLPCNWATVEYSGIKYRMNGQHSSEAIVVAGDDLPTEIVIHLDHFQAPDRDGMGTLFRQFDARFSGRNKQDVSGAYQGLMEGLQGCKKPHVKLGIEGVAWFERCVEGLPTPSGDDLYGKVMSEAYHKFLLWLNDILTLKTPELKRTSIVGAMYGTYIASESGAQEFWSHVAKNDLTDDEDPRSVLSIELVRLSEEKGKGETPRPADFYAKCVKAWAAFRSGEKIRSLNVNTKKGLPAVAA